MQVFKQYVKDTDRDKISLNDHVIEVVMSYLVTEKTDIRYDCKTNQEGMVEIYDSDGSLVERGSYYGNVEHGKFTVYVQKMIYQQYHYKNGKLHGEFKRWSSDGNLIEQCNYQDNCLQGELKRWWNDGALMHIQNYTGGLQDGYQHYFHKNGKKSEEYHYILGDQEGEQKTYYQWGTIREVYNMRNNLKYGKYIKYYANERKQVECHYDNLLEGEYTEWLDDGRMYINCFYVKGKMHGIYREYDGDTLYEKEFQNGVCIAARVKIIE